MIIYAFKTDPFDLLMRFVEKEQTIGGNYVSRREMGRNAMLLAMEIKEFPKFTKKKIVFEFKRECIWSRKFCEIYSLWEQMTLELLVNWKHMRLSTANEKMQDAWKDTHADGGNCGCIKFNDIKTDCKFLSWWKTPPLPLAVYFYFVTRSSFYAKHLSLSFTSIFHVFCILFLKRQTETTKTESKIKESPTSSKRLWTLPYGSDFIATKFFL